MSAQRYAVALRRLAPRARFDACAKPEDLVAALQAAGLPLPERHNTSIKGHGQVQVDWLGPRRYVVSAPIEHEEVLGNTLKDAFGGFASADLVCVTDMVVGFDLAGEGAVDVLAQLISLDLGLAAFAPASATATELWGVGVVVERPLDEPSSLRLTVERSFAGYVEGWLRTAAGLSSDLLPGVMSAPPEH